MQLVQVICSSHDVEGTFASANRNSLHPGSIHLLVAGSRIRLQLLQSGNATVPGSDPLAAIHAGDRFGHDAPRAGNGCAVLLREEFDGRTAACRPRWRHGCPRHADHEPVQRKLHTAQLAGEKRHPRGAGRRTTAKSKAYAGCSPIPLTNSLNSETMRTNRPTGSKRLK